jgi:transcriptional regulator with XRE-family HTH domain
MRPRKKEAEPGTFGAVLKERRKSQGMSVIELANKSGVSYAYISQLEKGEHPSPSPKVIRQLAGALDILPITLKLCTGQVEFWDLYPVDLDNSPEGYSLSEVDSEEQIQLLWFLKYIRTSGYQATNLHK